MTVNPILAFSARRRMRSARTALLLTLYSLAVLVFGLIVAFGDFMKPQISIYAMGNGLTGYAAMLAFQFFLLLLVTPAMTAGAISGERERQTLDLLHHAFCTKALFGGGPGLCLRPDLPPGQGIIQIFTGIPLPGCGSRIRLPPPGDF